MPLILAPPPLQDGGRVLDRLREDSITTMGSDRIDIDFEAAWRKELGAESPARPAAAGGIHAAATRLGPSKSQQPLR